MAAAPAGRPETAPAMGTANAMGATDAADASAATPAAPSGCARIAAVVVAWRPDPARLRALLASLSPQVETVYLVDNAEAEDEPSHRVIEAATAAFRGPAMRAVAMGGNQGIAAAQNRGIDAARAGGHDCVLLSDDDSLPAPDMVQRLQAALRQARAAGRRVAAVGPLVGDARDEAAVLVFGHTWIGPRRIAGFAYARGPMQAAFLVASGCLVCVDALAEVGTMREDLFIDHVDLEWSLRARQAGWELLAVPTARLEHRLGDRVIRLPWNGRPFHVHAPVRNYYLSRNTLLLLRTGLPSAGWRLGYLLWLVKYTLFNLAFVPPRRARLAALARGLRDGLAGRGGRLPTIIP